MRSEVKSKSKPSFDFNQYMKERATLIDAALDKSVPLQYPEVINESMRYSLLAGGRAKEMQHRKQNCCCFVAAAAASAGRPTECAGIPVFSVHRGSLPAC